MTKTFIFLEAVKDILELFFQDLFQELQVVFWSGVSGEKLVYPNEISNSGPIFLLEKSLKMRDAQIWKLFKWR